MREEQDEHPRFIVCWFALKIVDASPKAICRGFMLLSVCFRRLSRESCDEAQEVSVRCLDWGLQRQ